MIWLTEPNWLQDVKNRHWDGAKEEAGNQLGASDNPSERRLWLRTRV